MAEITRITTGFLVDNLFSDTDGIDTEESARRYQDALWDRLESTFAGVDILVQFQTGGGSLPYYLKTHIHFRGEPTPAEEEEATAWVEQIFHEVYDDGGWVVEHTERLS
jgi:hypothetical protein